MSNAEKIVTADAMSAVDAGRVWQKPRLQVAEMRHTANAAGPEADGGSGFQNGMSPTGS